MISSIRLIKDRLSARRYGRLVLAIGRVAWVLALALFLTVLTNEVCHYVWYFIVPRELLQDFHLRFWGSQFAHEGAHPEVPRAEDFPFWSAPGVALAALAMSTFLRDSLARSILAGSLVFACTVWTGEPRMYEWPSPGKIDLVWAIAAAIGAAVPALLRRWRHPVNPLTP